MKVSNFFKTLNSKINKYNQAAVNPFTHPQQIVLIWVEEDDNKKKDKDILE